MSNREEDTSMRVKIIKFPTDNDWIIARNNALFTKRKENYTDISSSLKIKFLASEHSTIRSLEYIWQWENIPYWVSVHFTRHHVGITHFVSSQRNDIQFGYDRKKAPQDTLVNHRCLANVQAIINISKARLCSTASSETRIAWKLFLSSVKLITPELYSLCVKPCVYRNGICPEVFRSCGYNKTDLFKNEIENYLSATQENQEY